MNKGTAVSVVIIALVLWTGLWFYSVGPLDIWHMIGLVGFFYLSLFIDRMFR